MTPSAETAYVLVDAGSPILRTGTTSLVGNAIPVVEYVKPVQRTIVVATPEGEQVVVGGSLSSRADRAMRGRITAKGLAHAMARQVKSLERSKGFSREDFYRSLLEELPSPAVTLSSTEATQGQTATGYKELMEAGKRLLGIETSIRAATSGRYMTAEYNLQQLAANMKSAPGVREVLLQRMTVGWADKTETTYKILLFVDPVDIDAGEEAMDLFDSEKAAGRVQPGVTLELHNYSPEAIAAWVADNALQV